MLQGFKQFILKGNVVSLAVGVVIGAAFSSVVTAFTEGFISPLIGLLIGEPDFSAIQYTINDSTFLIGDFLNALVSFLLTAFVIYFLVVVPMNHLLEQTKKDKKPADPTSKKCPECLSEIPLDATRCAFCTSVLKKK